MWNQQPSSSHSLDPPSLQHQHQQLRSTIARLTQQGRPVFVVTDGRPDPETQRQEELRRRILSYNRKAKSLEELSRKFIESFEGRDGIVIELDKATRQFDVQRRRIYDIVNIFESLQVIRKLEKNKYVWRGLKKAVETIETVQKGQEYAVPCKREKSLENLAARFLRFFISAKEPVALENASKVLMHTEDPTQVKTKIRRLYDIVNVFKSISIVQRVRVSGMKPSFQWQGLTALEELIAKQRLIWSEKPSSDQPLKENAQHLSNQQPAKISNPPDDPLLPQCYPKRYSQKVFIPSILIAKKPPQLPSFDIYNPQ